MKNNISVLMDLIKSEVTQSEFEVHSFLALSEQEQRELLQIAEQHSLLQLVGDALGNSPETERLDISKAAIQASVLSLWQTNTMDAECHAICEVLEKQNIPYIRLKGSRIRPLYPEPWMRSSGDIDILVPEDRIEEAVKALEITLKYQFSRKNYHDIAMYSPSGIFLELHFSIKEHTEPMDQVLEQVWKYSKPVDTAKSGEYLQTNEFFVFHQVAHMAYHFIHGGCGIRPFLDLFIIKQRLTYDEAEVIRLCSNAGIEKFYHNVNHMISVWFNGGRHTDLTLRMEWFILSGGTFGTKENQIAIAQRKQGSKRKYVMSRIFMSSEDLCSKYPSMKNRRWLAPVYQVVRWTELFNPGKIKSARRELEINKNISSDTADTVNTILRENGLI